MPIGRAFSARWQLPARHEIAASEEAQRAPLFPQALTVLEAALAQGEGVPDPPVFPNGKKPLANMAVMKLMHLPHGFGGYAVHGFRSTFRDWGSESRNYSHEVCEMALAHTITNAVEAAYRRGDLLEQRRQRMAD